MRDTLYLGRVYESYTVDGRVEWRWLHAYWIRGHRRFALTERDAREAVDRALRGE